MISVNRQGQRVQLRAAAVVLHEDDVLLHRAPGDERWALPGGRVAFGEEASTTAVRDMKEELGEAVSCGPFLDIGENFIDLAGQRNHEFGLYLLVSLGEELPYRDNTRVHIGVEDLPKLEFRWVALKTLGTVDLRPSSFEAVRPAVRWRSLTLFGSNDAQPLPRADDLPRKLPLPRLAVHVQRLGP